ncbi:unnamed protein product, partial [Symbiodinium sp. KB8]
FQSPLSCKTISAKLSAVATGFSADPSAAEAEASAPPPGASAPELGPAPAAAQAAPPWSLRGKDPCVPVLGQQVALGAREPFQYVPSAMEKEWFSQPRAGQICQLAQQQKEQAALWLNYSKDVFKPSPGEIPRNPSQEEAQVLSHFRYQDGRPHWIEPLSGVARNPQALCSGGGPEADRDIQYLVLENYCAQPGAKPRAKLFDMASTPKWKATILQDDFQKADYRSQFGAVNSVVLLFNMFRDRCLEFDDLYVWEGGQINQKDWWEPLPDYLRARTRFYNVAVNETHCALTATGIFAEKGSFLHMLPYAAKPDDYVVVKLDVRSGPELSIMEALARHPELSSLVDEVFLEYRFDFDGKKMDWGPLVDQDRNVDTALDLMKRLRLAGIRSHFWMFSSMG